MSRKKQTDDFTRINCIYLMPSAKRVCHIVNKSVVKVTYTPKLVT